MNLTLQQQAVTNAKLNRGEMLMIEARAGTGKTSTFVSFSKARPTVPMLYLAFNKSVQEEANAKFPEHVRCRTVHSLAYSTYGRKYADSGIGSEIYHWAVMKRVKMDDVYIATLVCLTVEAWLNSADDAIAEKHLSPDDRKKFNEKMFKEDLGPKILMAARIIWKDMVVGEHPFKMTHSGYLKLYQLSKPRLPQDVILLDEAQDTNPVTFDIVKRQAQFGTMILLSGDPYQQIYSWRGAVDAMQTQTCAKLYLTKSFRFGDKIASVANALLKTFFNETEPLIGNGEPDAIVDSFKGQKYTAIFRTNVELFSAAVSVVAAEKTIHVIGQQGFSTFLSVLMEVYYLYSGQVEKIPKRSPVYWFRSYPQLKEFALDRMDADMVAKTRLIDKFGDNIPYHVDRVKTMHRDEDTAHVILVTAHKSKGLEWDNVVISNDFTRLFEESGRLVKVKQQIEKTPGYDPLLHKKELEKAVDKDEINLIYVAVTRARVRLKLNTDLCRLMGFSATTPIPDAPVDPEPAPIAQDDVNDEPFASLRTRGGIREMFDKLPDESSDDEDED